MRPSIQLKIRQHAGFTLIELLVVISILAILAAILSLEQFYVNQMPPDRWITP